jgi:hypothetical protein
MTSETSAASTEARLSASVITTAPRSCAGTVESEPLKEPMAVRTALAMTISDMDDSLLCWAGSRRVAASCVLSD